MQTGSRALAERGPIYRAAMETVIVERAEGIVTVTMNRPAKRNAANTVMWRELRDSFDDIASRHEDRVMVLTGAGGAFCSGADLSDLAGPNGEVDPRTLMRQIGEVALALHRLPKPTIAKVNGMAVGAGCNMALACDLVVASDGARFCEIFSRRGLSLDFGGSWLLPRLVGLHRAKELSYFGDMVSAQLAVELGLINRVVPAAELDGFSLDWAQRLAAGPPAAVSMTKSMLNRSFEVSLGQALDDEAQAQAINFSSQDAAEGLAAFVERRQPRFQGR